MLVADSIKYVYSITLFTSKMITGTVCVGYPAALPLMAYYQSKDYQLIVFDQSESCITPRVYTPFP